MLWEEDAILVHVDAAEGVDQDDGTVRDGSADLVIALLWLIDIQDVVGQFDIGPS